MTRLGIAGACGRMGKRIAALAQSDSAITLTAALEMQGHACVGKDYGICAGLEIRDVVVASDAEKVLSAVDVLVDFSAPDAVAKNVLSAMKSKKAVVVGTTGLDGAAHKAIERASGSIPIVLSPNMSPGVNLLFEVLPHVARALGGDYDIEIHEVHHRMKKDAPSGTAAKMAEILAAATGARHGDIVHGRHGSRALRRKGEIGVHAQREGDVVGDHSVSFAADGEIVTLSHRATSRDTFASGALRAAKYAAAQKPGLYSMQDVMRA